MGDFHPQFVRKRQVRLPDFDEKVLAFCAHGMATREIQSNLREVYEVHIWPSLISRVTDADLDEVKVWQSRRLDGVYPIVCLDTIYLKVRTDGRVQNHAVCLALGIEMEGKKQLLGCRPARPKARSTQWS